LVFIACSQHVRRSHAREAQLADHHTPGSLWDG